MEIQTIPVTERHFDAALREKREIGDFVSRGKVTLDQFVTEEYLPHICKTRKSWTVSERLLRRFVSPSFGHRIFREIKRSEVLTWLNDLQGEGYRPLTCNRILAAFKAMCTYAEIRGALPFGNSPCYRVPGFGMARREAYPLSDKDLATLMDALGQSEKREAYAIRLLILTGARKNEILHARWEQVDWDRGLLKITSEHSARPRDLALSAEALGILKNIARKDGSEWIFPIRGGTRPMDNIFHYWKRLREELGLDGMRIEDLRQIRGNRDSISHYGYNN